MKTKIVLILCLALGAAASNANAQPLPSADGGVNTGNGGSGIRCGARGALELRDFWEAENPADRETPALRIARSNSPAEEQLESVARRLEGIWPDYAFAFRRELARLQRIKLEAPRSMELPETHDLGYRPSCRGVRQRQIAAYVAAHDGIPERLYISMRDFDHLRSETDRAGLWAHEAIYAIDRFVSGASTSEHTRLVVGKLFSEERVPLAELAPHGFANTAVLPHVGLAMMPGETALAYQERIHTFQISHQIFTSQLRRISNALESQVRSNAALFLGNYTSVSGPLGFDEEEVRITASAGRLSFNRMTFDYLADPRRGQAFYVSGGDVWQVDCHSFHNMLDAYDVFIGNESTLSRRDFGPNFVNNEEARARQYYNDIRETCLSGTPVPAVHWVPAAPREYCAFVHRTGLAACLAFQNSAVLYYDFDTRLYRRTP